MAPHDSPLEWTHADSQARPAILDGLVQYRPRNLHSERAPTQPTPGGPDAGGAHSHSEKKRSRPSPIRASPTWASRSWSSCTCLGSTPRDSDLGSGAGTWRFCISDLFSGDPAAAGSRATLGSAELNPCGCRGQVWPGAGDGHFACTDHHSQNLASSPVV